MPYVDQSKPGAHSIFLFTLSTCATCAQVKKLLDELEAPYDYLNLDHLDDQELDEALDEMTQYNPAQTFPTTVFPNRVIVGYHDSDLRQLIERVMAKK